MGTKEEWAKTLIRVDLDSDAFLEVNAGFMGGVCILFPPEFIAILDDYREGGMAWMARPQVADRLIEALQTSRAAAMAEMQAAA